MRFAARDGWLLILTLTLAFNFVDRLALGIMLQDIKADLRLTDTQLGLLTGIAFAVLYALMGVPLARWADRGNRVTIISVTVALWSLAVATCGAATSFMQLMIARIVVGVGEAGFEPPALSLLSDYFSRSERSRAIARYKLGWPLALIIGNLAAGWLNEYLGWRLTFVVLGVPGLVLAGLALTLREPRRAQAFEAVQTPAATAGTPTLAEVASALWRNATYRQLGLCFLLSTFFTTGILQWQPAYFVRSHGLETGELGTLLAIFYGGGTLLGTFLGGELTHRYAATDERLQLIAIAVLYAFFGALQVGVYLAPNPEVAFVLLAVSVVGGGATNGPLFAATQTLVPSRMRAMSVAVVLFFSNLVGVGLGPLMVGVGSDLLEPRFGADSLRYALVAMCPGYLWCSWCLWRASRTANEDVALAHSIDPQGETP